MSALSQDPDDPTVWLIPAAYQKGVMVQHPTVITGVHLPAECAGHNCIVHNPTGHHMRRWPLLWDDSRKIFLRVCEHGQGHPDPDGWGTREHECDGDCQRS